MTEIPRIDQDGHYYFTCQICGGAIYQGEPAVTYGDGLAHRFIPTCIQYGYEPNGNKQFTGTSTSSIKDSAANSGPA